MIGQTGPTRVAFHGEGGWHGVIGQSVRRSHRAKHPGPSQSFTGFVQKRIFQKAMEEGHYPSLQNRCIYHTRKGHATATEVLIPSIPGG